MTAGAIVRAFLLLMVVALILFTVARLVSLQ